ncbi:MAG: IclR family transcriptional regulator [Lachnospiraceae bacterium]|nr:IclR family transcriptional regulator [Lachnospiraceae bacterium]
MEEKNPIQVSERIFRTIECMAQNGPIGLLDLSKELSLNKTTVHRILNSLICMDYVKQDPDTLKYSLTFKICSISNQILSQNTMIDIARPYLHELAEQTGEIVHLVQLIETEAVYIDKVEATRNTVRLVSMVGKMIPLYCSGVGKAMLADMPDEKIDLIWKNSKIRKLTDYTITDYQVFRETIEQIRRNGYALDNEENEIGVRCVAVSLKNLSGKSTYAISVSAPKDRMSDERILQLTELILQTKNKIQQEYLF